MEMASSRAHRCTDHCNQCAFSKCLLVLPPHFPVLTPHHLYFWNERMSLCIGKNHTEDIKSHTLMVCQRSCRFKKSSMSCLTTRMPMQKKILNSKPHKYVGNVKTFLKCAASDIATPVNETFSIQNKPVNNHLKFGGRFMVHPLYTRYVYI
jgi:hypothetical protein